jgi:hypothetical protein
VARVRAHRRQRIRIDLFPRQTCLSGARTRQVLAYLVFEFAEGVFIIIRQTR